jgi:hypothetical protein
MMPEIKVGPVFAMACFRAPPLCHRKAFRE